MCVINFCKQDISKTNLWIFAKIFTLLTYYDDDDDDEIAYFTVR